MSLNGKIVFASGRATDFDIWSLDLSSGKLFQLTCGANFNEFPRWSPDGSKIAFISAQDDLIPSVWVMDADGKNGRRLTTKTYCQHPSWSPDGKRILFTANSSNPDEIEICEISADGGPVKTVISRYGVESDPSWSPDGRSIIFSAQISDGKAPVSDNNTEIIEYDVEKAAFKQLTSNPSKDYGPAYSPDGTKIAFISHRNRTNLRQYQDAQAKITAQVARGDMRGLNESIRALQFLESDGDVFVMNRDGSGLKQLSEDSYADQGVSWSPCGNYLVYTSTSMKALAAERLKIIDAVSGKPVSFSYDRTPLSREIGAEQLLDGSILQKLVPNFIERRFVDRSFWGEERHPHWAK